MKTKFEVITKNNKKWVRMTNGDWVTDCLIYGLKTKKPYIKYLGSKWDITGELKMMLEKKEDKKNETNRC